jgi:hypothetical protein
MSDRMQLEYEVSVTGLGEAAITAENAGKSADQAAAALNSAKTTGSQTLPVLLMSVRSLNASRLAVQQTSRAITELDPQAALYGFLNMMQVVRNLTSLTTMLKESTGAASAAQAILATLTGNWWIIPVALAAGAIVYSKIKSMQTGGPVEKTGLYLLHEGEYVQPAEARYTTERTTTIIQQRLQPVTHASFGPVFVTFQKQPDSCIDSKSMLRALGPKIMEQIRRGV